MKYDDLRALINYNPSTGDVTWRERPLSSFKTVGYAKGWNRRFAGETTGYELVKWDAYMMEETYVTMRITVNNNHYNLAKIIWLYMTGEFPQGHVQFRNGDRRDMRWSNLTTLAGNSGASFF